MTESTDRLDSTKLNSVESASTNIADKKVPIAVSSTHQSIDSKTINHTPKAMYVTSDNSITPKDKLDKMPSWWDIVLSTPFPSEQRDRY